MFTLCLVTAQGKIHEKNKSKQKVHKASGQQVHDAPTYREENSEDGKIQTHGAVCMTQETLGLSVSSRLRIRALMFCVRTEPPH